jgi:dihydrofolate reductase
MSVIISTIVAVAKNGVIGRENATPWYLPAELAHFKEITMGHPIIMGRKTHESIGRALPGRTNIIISRNPKYKAAEGSIVADSLEKALDIAKSKDKEEVFVIGGQAIYDIALPKVKRIYLTRVNVKVKGDKFFKYDPKQWQQASSKKHKADEKNPYDYEFLVLERSRGT